MLAKWTTLAILRVARDIAPDVSDALQMCLRIFCATLRVMSSTFSVIFGASTVQVDLWDTWEMTLLYLPFLLSI